MSAGVSRGLLWIGAAGATAAFALQIALSFDLPRTSTTGVYRASLAGGLALISVLLTFGCLLTILLTIIHAEREPERSPADGAADTELRDEEPPREDAA